MALWFRVWRAGFVLFILCLTLSHQVEASSDDHRHDQGRAPSHCCGVCHAGHLTALQLGATLIVGPRFVTGFCRTLQECRDVREPLLVLTPPRGPPV